jgi:hypothetical protein
MINPQSFRSNGGSTVFHDENQNWEEQLQLQAGDLLARRFSALEARVRQLQATLNEACAQLLGQAGAALSAEDLVGLRQHYQQTLGAATAGTERQFQAQLAQAREEVAATRREAEEKIAFARQEAEAQMQELRRQLEASQQAPAPAAPQMHEVKANLLKTAIEEIDAQRTQSDTLSTLVHCATQFTPRIVFFVVKSGNAVGWKTHGFTNGLNDESVRSLAVSVQSETLLREALDSQRTARIGPQAESEYAAVLGRYGAPPAQHAVAVPLVVRGKAAAVLYADSGSHSGEAINTEALETLLRVTSMAIELLPVRRSTEQARPAAAPAPAASAPPATFVPPPPPEPPVFYGGMGEDRSARVEPAAGTGATQPFQVETAPSAFAQAGLAAPVAEERVEPSSSAPAAAGSQKPADPLSGITNEADVRAHNDARRFARLLVSEIKLYNEAKVAEGRRSHDLYERLKDDIDRSRQMYEKRVSPAVAAKFDYFYDELVHTLGEGDSSKLGSGCPGPTVPV